MKAFILAAGEGRRMRPLTNNTPKPLLEVGGKPLIQHHIENLRDAGVTELVINAKWLASKLIQEVGDGSRYGVSIHWSVESEKLETGGGIRNALHLLGQEPFLLVNGDVWSDFTFAKILATDLADNLGHLLLVENPPHHPAGDFSIESGKLVRPTTGQQAHTYSGIALLRPQLFERYAREQRCLPLVTLLWQAIAENRLSGELYSGRWCDVGTPERLKALRDELG